MARDSRKNAEKTPKGLPVPNRSRSSVLRDFERVAGPLRGHNRDQKPKA